MWFIIAFLLILIVAAGVLWPYLRPQRLAPATVELDPRLTELYMQRDMLYQAIRDAQFDLETGKLSQEDFAGQSGHLKQQAAETLRAIDTLEAQLVAPAIDQQIEAAVAAARQMPPALKSSAGNGHAPLPAPRAQTASVFCTQCGAPLRADDRFCARCGSVVSGQ